MFKSSLIMSLQRSAVCCVTSHANKPFDTLYRCTMLKAEGVTIALHSALNDNNTQCPIVRPDKASTHTSSPSTQYTGSGTDSIGYCSRLLGRRTNHFRRRRLNSNIYRERPVPTEHNDGPNQGPRTFPHDIRALRAWAVDTLYSIEGRRHG